MAHVGAVVIYTKAGRSALATVASGPGADGACDLDTGERVRPETIAVLQPDQVVEYHSASMNKWIPARVLRTGRAPGTFDLDCKEAVDKSRVRLPDSFVSALPGSAAGFGVAGGAKGAGPLGLADGQLCFYKSGTHGWLAAQVVRFRPEDGTYDLDIKQQANPSSVRSIAAGALVEYHSTSQDTWILARVLRARAEPGTWDLDCKEMVHMSRLRPSPEGTQVASQASMAGPPGSAPAAGAPVAAGAPAPAPWPSDPHLLPFDQRLGLFQGAGAAAQPADAPQAPGPAPDSFGAMGPGAAPGSFGAAAPGSFGAMPGGGLPGSAPIPPGAPKFPAAPYGGGKKPSTSPPMAGLPEDGQYMMSEDQEEDDMRQRKLEQLRMAMQSQDPSALAQRLNSQSVLSLQGEELDRAAHELWKREALPGAIKELHLAMSKGDSDALEAALEAAAVVGVADAEIRQATRKLLALQAPVWQYCPSDGHHIDIRTEPKIDGERGQYKLRAGDVFSALEEKKAPGGILFLRISDGRGWAFNKKPGVGTLCRRFPVEEDDAPGNYIIIHHRTAVTPTLLMGADDEVIGKLGAGTIISVLEVTENVQERRIRGRLENPAGWISLLDTESGRRWAIPHGRAG